jgi:ribosomal protein L37AE/L43A
VPVHRPSRTEAESRRKAVLFCPDCDHESDIEGDWNVHDEEDRRVYDCPDCGTTITTRPRATPLLTP